MKIIADNKIPFLKDILEPIAMVEYYPGKDICRDILLDADALIIRSRTYCNSELLHGTNVKFIASATIGFDHIDQKFCRNNNIVWANAPGCNSGAVQQYVFSALIAMSEKYNFNLADKILGIIGVGNIGRKVAEMAGNFGMNCLLNDPPRERVEGSQAFVSLDEILKRADIITFHVPLNREGVDKTSHLADKSFISRLKPGAIVINTSRGEVIQTQAIKDALRDHEIKAVLDVWEPEPNIDLELLNLVDIATPHIAGYSYDGKANGTAMTVNAVSKFFNLGYDNWYPANVPVPENNIINANDLYDISTENILSRIIKTSYDIMSDNKRLRSNPQKFELFRDDYPIRREYMAYKMDVSGFDDGLVQIMKKMGVNLIRG